MAATDDIKKLNDEIQKLTAKLGGKPLKIFNVSEINEAEKALKGLKAELKDIQSDIGSISSAFKTVVDEISKGSKGLSDSKKSFNSLSGLAQQLKNDQEGINKLNKKQLTGIKEKIKAERANLVTTKDVLNNKKDTVGLTKEEEQALTEINGVLTGNDGLYKNLLLTAKERLAEEEKINDALGLGGALVGGVKKALDKLGMGGLVDQLGIEDAQKAMRKVADEVTNGGKEAVGFSGKLKVLGAGFASLGKSIIKNLKDPLAIAKFLADQLIDAIISVDAGAGDLAKNLNMSYNEALATRKEFAKQANESGNVFVTTKGIQESQMAINNALGTSVVLAGENAIAFTEMRDMAGFTNEELIGINNISLATGKSMNDITGEFMAQAKMSAMQNGVLLNEKSLLKDIGKVSAATTLSFGKNPKLIGEAVATAKSLGMEMSKVEGIADSLLDFESSIENELQAELLLGKNINLEKARQAALNNDLATVAKEISNQIGDSADFSKMNRIQQDALAKSVGMNRDSLAETLFVQEQLAGATGDQAKEQEKLLQKRIKEVGLAQATAEIEKDGIEGLREQNSQAEKFQAMVMKIKDAFVQLVTPIMQIVSPIVDLLVPALETVSMLITPILEAFNGIGEVFSAIMDPSKSLEETLENMGPLAAGLAAAFTVVGAAVLVANAGLIKTIALESLLGIKAGIVAVAKMAAAAAGTLGLGMVGVVAGLAVGMGALAAYYATADDMIAPAGYGDRVLSTPKGSIALNNQDTLVAGTNLGQGGGGGGTDMSTTNALLSQLIKKTPEMAPLGLYEVQ